MLPERSIKRANSNPTVVCEKMTGLDFAHLLLQIAAVLGLCRVLHGLLRRAGQPPVVGEMIAGLLLGPSFFGWLSPRGYDFVFPPFSLPSLNALSQIGLVLFMFVVGLRLELREVREFRHVAGLAGLLSMAVPFAAGLAIARPLHRLSADTPMVPFSLFIAVSMSITAFPVLARILSDQKLTESRLGQVSIACAALNDVCAWTLLAWITAVARSRGGYTSIVGTVAPVATYALIMAAVIRPALARMTRRFAVTNELPVVLVVAFLSSWATERIGIHALFGAFFAGVIWPRFKTAGRTNIEELSATIEPVATVVLVPLFFSFTGIRTNIGSAGGSGSWPYAVLIVATAVAAKVGGAFLGGIAMRFGVRDSLALGVLLNTRGLVELIALNVGLDLGILSPRLFSMMVLMAIGTTLMTSPLLKLVGAHGHLATRGSQPVADHRHNPKI